MVNQPRLDVVEQLIAEALVSMTGTAAITSATPAEVHTACMNIALRAMHTAARMGGDMSQYREVVETMYCMLPPPGSVN
jgi:hypothetical protein